MISEEVHSVTIFQSALYKTNSAVIRTEDMVLVVDPCWLPGEVETIRRYVDDHLDGKPLYLLFTHSDYDHIIGYRAFPEAAVIASLPLSEKSEGEQVQILEQIFSFDDEYYLERNYEIVYPKVNHKIGVDEQCLEIGGTRLVFYLSPGHTSDSMFTVVEPLGLLITGDYLSDVEFPFIEHSVQAYEESLRKLDVILSKHDMKALLPGHGRVTKDLGEIKKRQSKDLAYISEMRRLTALGKQEEMDQLIEGCPFPRNLRKVHQSNKIWFAREMGEDGPGSI